MYLCNFYRVALSTWWYYLTGGRYWLSLRWLTLWMGYVIIEICPVYHSCSVVETVGWVFAYIGSSMKTMWCYASMVLAGTSPCSVEMAGGIELVFCTYPTLCFKEIQEPPKIRVLLSGTLSQTLDVENFSMARQSLQWVVNKAHQRSSFVYQTYDSLCTVGHYVHRPWYGTSHAPPFVTVVELLVTVHVQNSAGCRTKCVCIKSDAWFV